CEWDEGGQLKAVTGPSDQRYSYVYDNYRQVIEEHDDVLGFSTRYDYDRAGRLSRVRDVDPQGRTICAEQYYYDPEGNVTRFIDGLGNETRFRYAGFNQVVERIDALGYRRRLEHDTEERIVRIENERAESFHLDYDRVDRVIRETGFDGRVREFEYYPTGHV